MMEDFFSRVSTNATAEANITAQEFACAQPLIGNVSDQFRIVGLVQGVIGVLFMIVSVGLWWRYRSRTYLKVRPFAAVLLSALAFLFSLLGGAFRRYTYGNHNWFNTCEMTTFMNYAALIVYLASLFVRIMVFYSKHKLLELVVAFFAKETVNNEQGNSRSKVQGDVKKANSNSFMTTVTSAVPFGKEIIKYYQGNCFPGQVKMYRYRSSPVFVNKFAVVLATCALLLATLITVLLCPSFGVFGCNVDLFFHFSAVVQSMALVACILGFLVVRHATKNHPDPFGFTREVLIDLLVGTVLVIPVIISLSFGAPKTESSAVHFDKDIAMDVLAFFHFGFLVTYQVYLGTRHRDEHYDIPLAELLQHPYGKKLFRKHLTDEYSAPNLSFWTAVNEWKAAYKTTTMSCRENVAHNIYNRYINPKSETEVNISDATRKKVEKVLNGKYIFPRTLFDEASNEIFEVMESDSFNRFRVNGVYKFFMGLTNILPEEMSNIFCEKLSSSALPTFVAPTISV